MNFPRTKNILLYLFLLSLQISLTLSETKSTTIFIPKSNYIFGTSDLQINSIDLDHELSNFILSSSHFNEFSMSIDPSLLSRFREMPVYNLSFRMYYTFDEKNIYIILYNIMEKEFQESTTISMVNIVSEQYKDNFINFVLFSPEKLCFLELKSYDLDATVLVSVRFAINPSLTALYFFKNETLMIHDEYDPYKHCVVDAAVFHSYFIRFCRDSKSYDVFLYHPNSSRKIIQLTSMQNKHLMQVDILVKGGSVSILFLESMMLWKLQIDERGNINTMIVKTGVQSFYQQDFYQYYYVSSDNEVFYFDIQPEKKYFIEYGCERYIWFGIDDVFLCCINTLGSSGLKLELYLGSRLKIQKISLKGISLDHIICMKSLKMLAFFYTYESQPQPVLGLITLNKIQTRLYFDREKIGEPCDFFMNKCELFRVSSNKKQYSIYQFEETPNSVLPRYWGYLHKSIMFEAFDWKFNEEDNFIVVDDFITGYVKSISSYTDSTNYLQDNKIPQLRPKVTILESLSFELEKTVEEEIFTQGMLHTKTQIITYQIHNTEGTQLTKRKHYDGQSPVLLGNQPELVQGPGLQFALECERNLPSGHLPEHLLHRLLRVFHRH